MQKPNLQKLLSKWQRKLRLSDWDITISYGNYQDLGDLDSVGRTCFDTNNQIARVWILEPSLITNSSLSNIELTLIHELVHLVVDPAYDNTAQAFKEQAIEKLAKAVLGI